MLSGVSVAQERRRADKQEAVRVLRELRAVIAVRAVDMEARETRALERMRQAQSADNTEATQRTQGSDETATIEQHRSVEPPTDDQRAAVQQDQTTAVPQDQRAAVPQDEEAAVPLEIIQNFIASSDTHDESKQCRSQVAPSNSNKTDTARESDEVDEASTALPDGPSQHSLNDLKARLQAHTGFAFNAQVAALAAARSRDMNSLSTQDTFQDDSD